jgi:hypothetical protein
MFGLENIGKGSVEEAHRTVSDLMDRLSPMLLQVEHRAAGILHGLLTRLNGTEITIKVSIPPQPYPNPDSEIRKAEKIG